MPRRDREEEESPEGADVSYSADADARWVKKGGKSLLGYKAFARSDEEGFIDRVHATSANKGESPEFETMIRGARAGRVLADKAYASRKNREMLAAGHYKDGILHKATRGHPTETVRETI